MSVRRPSSIMALRLRYAFELGHLEPLFRSRGLDYNMNSKSRFSILLLVRGRRNHCQLDVPDEPRSGSALHRRRSGIRLREIGGRVGITERATHRIVVEVEAAGYVRRRREGRRNRYTIRAQRRLPDPVASDQRVGDLLGLLGGTRSNTKSR